MAEKNGSLEKALTVLDLFQTQRRVTLTSVVQDTGYSNASVNRILHSLENMHYLYHDRIDGGYYLTDKLSVLGRNTNLRTELINVLDEPVARLCRRSGFSVTVSIRRGTKSLTAFRKDPQKGLMLTPDFTDAISLNVTASGKVLTAFSGKVDELIEQIEYVRLTRKSVADREEYRDLIEEVQRERLAFDMEEITEGLVCVAAPICSLDGVAVCSISVSGYKERMIRELYMTISRLQDTAAECEQLLR